MNIGQTVTYSRFIKDCEYVFATREVAASCLKMTGLFPDKSVFRTALLTLDDNLQSAITDEYAKQLDIVNEMKQLHQFCVEAQSEPKSLEELDEITDATVPYIQEAFQLALSGR